MVIGTCLFLQPEPTSAEARERRDELADIIKDWIERVKLTLLGEIPNPDATTAGNGIIVTTIPSDLIEQVYQADIVVIDVSDYENKPAERCDLSPYLFYFMATSHSMGDKTILITNSYNHLPPSLITHHTLIYSVSLKPKEVQKLQTDFSRMVKEIITKGDKPDNPIREYYKKLKEKGNEQRIAELTAELNASKQRQEQVKEKEAELRDSEARAQRISFRRVN